MWKPLLIAVLAVSGVTTDPTDSEQRMVPISAVSCIIILFLIIIVFYGK